MDVVTLRRLTLKSILGIGKYKLISVQQIIDLGDISYLRYIYYCYSGIDFAEEVKLACKIKSDEEITKPGVDKELYERLLKRNADRLKHCSDYKYRAHMEKVLNAQSRGRYAQFCRESRMSKGAMQRINQGHGGRWK